MQQERKRNERDQNGRSDHPDIFSGYYERKSRSQNATNREIGGIIIEIIRKEGKEMTTGVQITLIICTTLILLAIINNKKGK